MDTVVPDPAAPARGPLTLNDWISAQRAVLEEEERLKELAACSHLRRRQAAEALERQRMRVQVAQDAADAIYDAVMQELRRA